MTTLDDLKKYLLDHNKLCTVTHPGQPNYSENSRGRKCHATLDGKNSLCKMLVAKRHDPAKGAHWSTINNGLCRICARRYVQEEA